MLLPWTLKLIVDEVALTPATEELSKRIPVVKVSTSLHLATNPEAPVPSTEPEAVEAMVICPGVVVVMVMLEPATRLVGP